MIVVEGSSFTPYDLSQVVTVFVSYFVNLLLTSACRRSQRIPKVNLTYDIAMTRYTKSLECKRYQRDDLG